MAAGSPGWLTRLFSWKTLLIYVAGGASAFLAIAVGAVVVVEGGLFNATASAPDIPAAAVVVHTAFITSVQLRARNIQPPGRFTSAQVAAGFRDYDASCAVCHGGPGVARADWTQGMTPTPPYIVDSARSFRPRELFWIVGQGARMTAMPAWGEVRTDGQLWDLVAFLEALPYLTAADYARMRANARAAAAAANAPPVAASTGHPRPTS
jgi:mono/diheme cytochrome c family protein